MNHLYLIALDLDTLRKGGAVDLPEVFASRFAKAPIRVVERGYRGRSVTVEMADSWVSVIRDALPFVTIERAREMELLERSRSPI